VFDLALGKVGGVGRDRSCANSSDCAALKLFAGRPGSYRLTLLQSPV